MELHHAPESTPSQESHDVDEKPEGAAPEGSSYGVGSVIVLLGAVVLLILIVLPLLQGGYGRARVSLTSYESFLEGEMNPGQLVTTVARRVSYRPEPDDYWSAPDAVWAARSGDCEDHAMVVSAYLSRHNVDHTLLGLSLKSGLEGHVVVVVTGENGPILLDPTGATAGSGIERFPPGTRLRDVAGKYATLPARRYGANVSPGDPEPVGIVE
ncbi:MAG: hypothetical protein WD492_02725 [Alkalispirochaeta sp.]